ncbi:McrB family protein [Bacillus alkalicellulosilyticus]|uniref:McrB family protein n=1 Tax=Alkalihalobacterium alkalicellulosilyticum TaxID=1912214 RepID=UPI000996EC9A|nr:AAA family ATPase [Bacillus alkalicellulosilyticus]
MLNLTYFQTVFNNDNTEMRCRQVLDEISPAVKLIFERFISSTGLSLGSEYFIRSYDTTLSTTYNDARNPTYAEKKKNSDIGRKYFIGLYRRVDDREYNMLTLEFNGMNQVVSFYTELTFIPMWSWVKNNKIEDVLSSIPEGFSITSSSKDLPLVLREELVSFVKSCVKPRKRPWFQVGTILPLQGEMAEEDVVNKLSQTWKELEGFRAYVNEESDIAKHAYDILLSIAEVRDIKETELLGRKYAVEISEIDDAKDHVKRQSIQIFDGEQLITKGYINYFFYQNKISPNQVIAFQLEGHNHIFTGSRAVLGKGVIEWWIPKLFATQNLDNQKVMQYAMELLRDHQFKVEGNHYYVGSFDNETDTFVEGTKAVKKNFIDSALLFAHASERLELPTDENGIGVPGETEGPDSSAVEPNFNFQAIYETISTSQFTFSKEIIRDLHLNLTALDDKHFVLLSGISGTGKTQLSRLYANAVYGLEYEQNNPYLTIIPVRPDWTDASALFGYYSSFEKRYVKTEFLSVLLHALKERDKPHFILLDEMNLARVEYYLSDYLSAVESRKEVPLHQDEETTDIPQKIIIPPNVYLLGTINVDETTHSISDKVLDRAFVMTLSDVDFETYWNRVSPHIKGALEKEFLLLKDLHSMLLQFELHFGYRTMGEMLNKLYANRQLPEEHQLDSIDALDRVISEKVLPKVRGDERISDLLEQLERWLVQELEGNSISLTHVKRMKEELSYYGATQFWR